MSRATVGFRSPAASGWLILLMLVINVPTAAAELLDSRLPTGGWHSDAKPADPGPERDGRAQLRKICVVTKQGSDWVVAAISATVQNGDTIVYRGGVLSDFRDHYPVQYPPYASSADVRAITSIRHQSRTYLPFENQLVDDRDAQLTMTGQVRSVPLFSVGEVKRPKWLYLPLYHGCAFRAFKRSDG